MAILPVTVVDLQAGSGTVSLPALSFTPDPDSGLYRIGADNIGIGVGGAKIVDIAATQVALNTGISMKVPGNTLGALAVGGNLYSHVMLAVGFEGNPLDYVHQVAVYAAVMGNSFASGAGSYVIGFESAIGTQPGSYTLEHLTQFLASSVYKAPGTTITRTIGFSVFDETAGDHNASIAHFEDAFTGNWFIYYGGTRPSYFGGNLTVGAEIDRSVDNSYIRIQGSTGATGGANIIVFGSAHASLPNQLQLNGSKITITETDAGGVLELSDAIVSLPITASTIPATPTTAGRVGSIIWDGSHLYLCTAANTWRRVAIATW